MKQWAFICAFSLLLLASLGGLAAWIHTYGLGNEISLPLLTIAGVMALLGSLAVVAVAFSMMNMSDRTQALGLPNGSVRAVIALSLVVLFAILSVYLFSSIRDSNSIKTASCLTDTGLASFQKQIPPSVLISAADSQSTPSGQDCPNAGVSHHTVYYHDASSTEGTDFAKQLLVLIGTLVTSVCGFYFGSKATADAQDSAAGLNELPTIRAAEPPILLAGNDACLTIYGSALNTVNQIQLVAGDQTMTDGNALSSSSQVRATFTIPPTIAGKCDIVAIDFLGRQTRLANAVEIQKPAADASPGDDGAKITDIQPQTLTRNIDNTVTISGANLADVKGLKLTASDGSVYTATSVDAVSTMTLTAKVKIPATAKDGQYAVTVAAADRDLASLQTTFTILG